MCRILSTIFVAMSFMLFATGDRSSGIAVLPTASAEENKKPKERDARETAKAWFDLALAGKHKEAAALGQPGQLTSESKVKSIAGVLAGQKIELKEVYADDERGLAITSVVKGERGETGPLAVALRKVDGRWT